MKEEKNWHLAVGADDTRVTEFELQLWRVYYGFVRWQEECENSIGGAELTGNELSVLHIIRMRDTPKTITDIGRLLNRNDIYNIRYTISKLLKLGLIKKIKSGFNSKNFLFQVTDKGIEDTDAYSEMRRRILIKMFSQQIELDLEGINKNLIKIKAIYDEADREVAFYKKSKPGEDGGEEF